jgi:hypothetical protein
MPQTPEPGVLGAFEGRLEAKLERIYDKIDENTQAVTQALTRLGAKDRDDERRDARLHNLEGQVSVLRDQVIASNQAIRDIPKMIDRVASLETWRTTITSAWTGPQKLIAGLGSLGILLTLIVGVTNLWKAFS